MPRRLQPQRPANRARPESGMSGPNSRQDGHSRERPWRGVVSPTNGRSLLDHGRGLGNWVGRVSLHLAMRLQGKLPSWANRIGQEDHPDHCQTGFTANTIFQWFSLCIGRPHTNSNGFGRRLGGKALSCKTATARTTLIIL